MTLAVRDRKGAARHPVNGALYASPLTRPSPGVGLFLSQIFGLLIRSAFTPRCSSVCCLRRNCWYV